MLISVGRAGRFRKNMPRRISPTPWMGVTGKVLECGNSGTSKQRSCEHFSVDLFQQISFLEFHERDDDPLVLEEGFSGVPRVVGAGTGRIPVGIGVV